jgi:glucan 1,3-beta-glucosidase
LPAAVAALVAIGLCAGFWAWRGRAVAMVDAPPTLPCVSYAPFQGTQSPFDETLVVPREQIEADLRILSRLTGCVRIYSIDQGLAQVPQIAEGLGLHVLLGAWLSRDAARNAEEIAAVIALANAHPQTVTGVIVGNEVLLRREMPPDRLIAAIREVAAAVEAPVSYADVWEFWLQHPEVADAVDVVTIHILPYWEDWPVAADAAVAHVAEVAERMRRAFPGKPILVGEVGWPSRGRMREQALPSPLDQARFVREMLVMADRGGLAINLMEGIDQPWKRRLEGTVGGFWGVLDAERRAKFPLTGPVTAEPHWRHGAGASTALALLPILWAAVRRTPLRRRSWFILATAAPAAACSLVLASLDVATSRLGLLDWALGLAELAIAAASVALAGQVLLTGAAVVPTQALPLIQRVRARRLPGLATTADAMGWLRLATLFAIAATALCLAFDGRYRDFPTAAYAPPVACFLALTWHQRRPARGENGLREEAALALIALAGAMAVLAVEGPGNSQALAWAGVTLAAAAIPLDELWPRSLQPDGPQCREEGGGGAELGVVEDQGHGAGGNGCQDRGSA